MLWIAFLACATAFEQRLTWVPNNLTGCLDDPYYFDVFFVYLGRGLCRVDENDETSNAYGTNLRLDAYSLQECLELCFAKSYCTGVEFGRRQDRCKIWNQSIGYVRGSTNYECVGIKEVDCEYFQDKNCTAEVYDMNTAKLQRLHSHCPNACTEVQPECPSGFEAREVVVGGLFLIASETGLDKLEREQYESGYQLFFEMNGQASAVKGEVEVVALSQDGSLQELEERAAYLTNRGDAKLLLGPYGDEQLEVVAQVAEESGAVLMAPSAKGTSHVNRSSVFSLVRPYAEVLLEPLQSIAAREMATVGYIMPSRARAVARNLLSNHKTCEQIPRTVQMANLVLLRGEVLEEVGEAAWPQHLAQAMERLLTPRPEVIICCESSLLCASEILNATYHMRYSPKAFMIFDDEHLTLPLNMGAGANVQFYQGAHLIREYVSQQLQTMGTQQTEAELDLWMWNTLVATAGYQDTWTTELMELLKLCLVVSDWDRNSPAAVGFAYLHHYLVRTHARPESALAAAAAAALEAATARANSTAPVDVAEQLLSLEMDTVIGSLAFDALRQRRAGSSLVQLMHYRNPPNMPMAGRSFFWTEQLTPGLRGTLQYPRTTWQELFCQNEVLEPYDGLAYGLVLDNVTQRLVCAPCPADAVSSWDPQAQHRVCLVCPAGQERRGGRCVHCEAGYFSDTAGADCSPCQPGEFQGRTGQSGCELCPPGTFNSQAAGLSCRRCSETFEPGQRPRWASLGSSTCSACPAGALCEPDENGFYTNYSNADGFYAFLNGSNVSFGAIYRCTHGEGLACLRRGQCHADHSGAPAMEGPMCGACAEGFAKPIGKPLNLCSRCPARTTSLLGVSLQIFTVLGMASFLMIVNFLSDYSKPKNILSIILKQLFNYIQMSFAVLSTGGAHGLYGGLSVVQIFHMLQDYLGMSSAAWVPESGACLLRELFPDWKLNEVLTMLGLLWFPLTALGSTLLFAFLKLFRRLMWRRKTDARHLKTWMMVNFFLYIPRVNRLLLINFQCQEFDINRLLMDPRVDCWSAEHASYQILSWSGILLFSVGGPVFLYLVLRYLHRRQLLNNSKVLDTYGFLFAGFEPDFYYFECVYMVRKLCFELVMTLPGMTSKDEEALGRINNSSVAFVASIFFALHMACQPYDNRDYFILDRIETASLRAILVTAFLQLWCLDTNEADGIQHNDWLRQARNTLCTAVISLLHLRFFWLFFYGMARRRIQGCLASVRGRDFSHGSVVFVPDGLQLRNLSGIEEELLATMVSEIYEMHSQTKRKVAYDHWAGSLQMLCLEARRAEIESDIIALDKVGNTLRGWRDVCRKLFRGSRVGLICERIIDRIEHYYGVVSNGTGYKKRKQEKDEELEELKTFSSKALNKLLNKEFRVEELKDSMLKLGRSICDNKRIAGLGDMREEPKPTMEFFVGPMGQDVSVFEERNTAQLVEDLRREVHERSLEASELRRQLTQRGRRKAPEVSVEVDSEPENEWLTELQQAQVTEGTLREERDRLQAELQQQKEETEQEEERRSQAQAALAEMTGRVRRLEDQLKKLHEVHTVCWSCRAKMPQDAIYCYKCGKALDGEM